jgi:hypothetical protein
MPSLDQERQGWRGLFRRDAKMGESRVGFLTQLRSQIIAAGNFSTNALASGDLSSPLVFALNL